MLTFFGVADVVADENALAICAGSHRLRSESRDWTVFRQQRTLTTKRVAVPTFELWPLAFSFNFIGDTTNQIDKPRHVSC